MDAISHPPPSPKRAMFGDNKHEGSFVLGMIYKGYLLPNDVMNNEHFLRHEFSATLLEALGLNDDSGVIYELINYRCCVLLLDVLIITSYRFFNINDLGFWDRMIDGMINVSLSSIPPQPHLFPPPDGRHLLHQGLHLRVHEVP